MDDLELAYILFTANNPIDVLKDKASSLSTYRKKQLAPLIRRADHFTKRSEKFRKLIRDWDQLSDLIGFVFIDFFENHINNKGMIVMDRSIAARFAVYLSALKRNGKHLVPDKYTHKAQKIIMDHDKEIDAFVKAFHSIRMAEQKLESLIK